jgi:hypothetical protein
VVLLCLGWWCLPLYEFDAAEAEGAEAVPAVVAVELALVVFRRAFGVGNPDDGVGFGLFCGEGLGELDVFGFGE